MRIRMTLTSLCLAAAAIVSLSFVALVAADQGAETEVAKTRLNLDPGGQTGHYSGKIKSERDACLKHREIRVVHLSDPPFTIGNATTDKDGYWELNGNVPPEGTPQKIKVIVRGSGNRDCEGARRVYAVGDIVRS